MSCDKESVNIIGAGLAGLSAAITLARAGVGCNLISMLPSERAQSVMAEGGINGALNTMGEDDCTENHFNDTMKAGVYIADEEAVRGFTERAPEILMELKRLGVPFNLQNEQIQQRNFGGQKKKRTAYARSSTGKVLMTALIDEARKFEEQGLINRFSNHELVRLIVSDISNDQENNASRLRSDMKPADQSKNNELTDNNGKNMSAITDNAPISNSRLCIGAIIKNNYTSQIITLKGAVILAYGGMNGMFPEQTTGTVTNSGDASALVFSQGVRFSNLEMIQYHPTTIGISGKRCLVSEAARGEGGRLYIMRNGKPWYFMEEKYPELGNLMPRDVVARESYFVTHSAECDDQVWLDLHELPKETWVKKLPDLRNEVKHYLGIDPAKSPIPVEPGIHYFMGGIDVDIHHKTNIDGLYAAGECCSQYHGANRLGGNSTMGAIYGGIVAAESMITELKTTGDGINYQTDYKMHTEYNNIAGSSSNLISDETSGSVSDYINCTSSASLNMVIRDLLMHAMGIVRNENDMNAALKEIKAIIADGQFNGSKLNTREENRLYLAKAMLECAILRKESRGAHYRSDYPQTSENYRGRTVIMAGHEAKLIHC